MFNIVLHQPKIASNTGAIIRLCANCGSRLHLIKPIAFELCDKRLRRAGLDYHEYASVEVWDSLDDLIRHKEEAVVNLYSSKVKQWYTEARYSPDCYLVFGSETEGLPAEVIERYGKRNCYQIPMKKHSRSLNLANAVSIVAYEGWRTLLFAQ